MINSCIKYLNELIVAYNINDKFNEGNIYSNGSLVYSGTVHNDSLLEGKYFYDKTSIYEGKFLDNMRNEMGKFIYNNNIIYNGEWSKDMKNGSGKMTIENNEIDTEWESNVLKKAV